MIELSTIYNSLILNKAKENWEKRYKGNQQWFHASQAGMCAIKHKLARQDKEFEYGVDEKTSRVLRLGDIVHEDIQNSVKKFYGSDQYLIEHEIRIPEWNVRGFLDIALVDYKKSTAILYDIKTAKAFKWTKMFGLKKNREKNPSRNYEYQITTYAYALAKRYNKVKAVLYYYKKDDSTIKEVPVDYEKYLPLVKQYWEYVNRVVNTELTPGDSLHCPVYSWECKYCKYAGSKCKSPFASM